MRKSQTNRKLVLICFFTFNCLQVIWNSDAVGADVSYKGLTKCEGMQTEVSFLFDRETSVIKKFQAKHDCIEGLGGSLFHADVDIHVGKDGSFYHKDKYGYWVKGKIEPSGKASGETMEGLFVYDCKKDGRFFKECTAWTATPSDQR